MLSPLLQVRPSYMPKYVPSSDCVLWFPGQEDPQSAVLTDKSGYGNNGAIVGATWTRLGTGLQILDYDSTNDITTVTDAASIQNIFDSGGTVLAWINPDSDGEGNAGRIFDKRGAASNVGWMSVLRNEAGGFVTVDFYQYFDNTVGTWITSNAVVPINVWSLIGITYNSSNVANNAIIYLGTGGAVTTPALTESSTPVGTRVSDVGADLLMGNRADTDSTFDGGIALERLLEARIITLAEFTNFYTERGLFGA